MLKLSFLQSMASLDYLSLPEKCFYFCFCFGFLPLSSAELWQFQHSVKADGSLSFLVIGDWGRRGAYNQSQVAFQMGRIGEDLNIDFVASTGDNFYDDGLKSINDLLFQESFTQIYTASSLQKQWYNVLGNHDYRGNVEAQLSPILRMMDSRWLCLRNFVVQTEIADFFFVDTTPFVDKYFLKPNKHTYDWRGIIPRKKYLTKLLRDVELAMRKSAANWKIVVGHHTIRSIGHHADTKELVQHLLPILEANNADMYINGHDHCLQHISSTRSPIQFLTSGGGSKAWKGEIDKRNRNGTRFYYDGQGFMSIQLTEAEARIIFYDVFGRALHNLNLFKQLNSAM
ncbi:purple acid phosphatase 8-like isoform X1 [Pistacia vera]|uniref:purple acid phosphatase 8-like isoform X1 n=1 Tax=Pistacia vera TaxID=55513 RepID=UPI001262F2BF|nr:purple acid phosphatase 8-like isoform X1 [Pistacia vera]